jgi:hypothetical protein
MSFRKEWSDVELMMKRSLEREKSEMIPFSRYFCFRVLYIIYFLLLPIG